MKGKAYVTNGTVKYPVKVVHWWPERQFRNKDGSLDVLKTGIFYCWFRGRRYATKASVIIPHTEWTITYIGVAECGKKDNPSRKVGRNLALNRLIDLVNTEELGDWELVEE